MREEKVMKEEIINSSGLKLILLTMEWRCVEDNKKVMKATIVLIDACKMNFIW